MTNQIGNIQFDITINPFTLPNYSMKTVFSILSSKDAYCLYKRGKKYNITEKILINDYKTQIVQKTYPHPLRGPVLYGSFGMMFGIMMHRICKPKIAKGILPGMMSLVAWNCIKKDTTILSEPFKAQFKCTDLICMYTGHALGDLLFIRDPTLIFHHILTICGSVASIINPKLRNISISLLASEMCPFCTSVMHVPRFRKFRSLLGVLRVMISGAYRIPLLVHIMMRARSWSLKCATGSFSFLELYWFFQMAISKKKKIK